MADQYVVNQEDMVAVADAIREKVGQVPIRFPGEFVTHIGNLIYDNPNVKILKVLIQGLNGDGTFCAYAPIIDDKKQITACSVDIDRPQYIKVPIDGTTGTIVFEFTPNGAYSFASLAVEATDNADGAKVITYTLCGGAEICVLAYGLADGGASESYQINVTLNGSYSNDW